MTLSARSLLLILATVLLLAACTPQAGKDSGDESRSTSDKLAIATPSADALLALERRALEAYIKGDNKYFEGILSDKLVMQRGGYRLGKTEVMKMIAGVKCEVDKGWALTEPKMSMIDDDTYALSYKSNMDGSCTGDGKTEKLPSPVRVSSIWVSSGEGWQLVFHGKIPIFDPSAVSASDKDDQPIPGGNTDASATATRAAVNRTSDPVSDALMAAERSLWDAWMKHDADKINQLTTREMAFVNLFGTYLPDKASAITEWTSKACEVTSFMLSNGVGSYISPTVGILTVTGTVNGTCSGQDISGQKIYGTTVYVKDGDAWKWAFGFNSPN